MAQNEFRSVLMTKRLLTTAVIVLAAALAGCVSLPPAHMTAPIESGELSDHVYFLAQPGLRGRKAGSRQSKTVRTFLAERFSEYGLVPWPGEESFELDFGRGVNMLGVLRGADPNLADEIVILAAHYDHIGRTEDGLCPGACDNAAAVAILLEIAEHLALTETRLKRSICFAAFDAEERMAMGSFAFTLRDSFKNARIAGVINMDLLGRDFLDVVDNSLFVMGAEDYPQLQTQIVQKGTQLGLKMLPVAPEIAGPTGDHAAFQTLGFPVIFFSCGYYSDYHLPGDTPKKLDYTAIENTAHLVLDTLRALADDDIGPFEPDHRHDAQLEALVAVSHRVIANFRDIGINAEEAAELVKLVAEAKRMIADPDCHPRDQRWLSLRIVRALKPAVKARCKFYKDARIITAWEQTVYANHQHFLLESYRSLVEEIITHPPGPFSRIDFKCHTREVSDSDAVFTCTPQGLCRLDVLVCELDFILEKKGILLPSVNFEARASWRPLCFGGTRAEAIDYCLLQWRKHADEPAWSQSWTRILRKISGDDPCTLYAGRLGPQSDDRNETAWLTGLSRHEHPQLAAEATLASGTDAMCRLITDPNMPADRRSAAIDIIAGQAGGEVEKDLLLVLAEVVNDGTSVDARRYWPRAGHADYPFAGHPVFASLKEGETEDGLAAFTAHGEIKTVGQLARHTLKQLTQQDFGADHNAWRQWISSHAEKKPKAAPPPFHFSTADLDKADKSD